jgi:hypothetical protein
MCLEGLRNATKHVGQDSRGPNQDSNRALHEQKSGVLLLDQPARLQ